MSHYQCLMTSALKLNKKSQLLSFSCSGAHKNMKQYTNLVCGPNQHMKLQKLWNASGVGSEDTPGISHGGSP